MIAAGSRLPSPFGCTIWRVDLDAALGAAPFDRILSDAERCRAARFVFDRDRRRYIAARAALRQLLGDRLGIAPEAVRLALGAHGKPRIEGPSAIGFNLSHSGERALIALADEPGGELGIDLECRRPMRDAGALAARYFTTAEQVAVAEADGSPATLDAAFLRIWTRKEACLKAVGCGLAVAPETLDVGLGPEPREVVVRWNGEEWTVTACSLETGDDGWLAALALTERRG